MNPVHVSQDRNTHDMERSLKPAVQQMSLELTVNKTIKAACRAAVVVGGFNLWIRLELMGH